MVDKPAEMNTFSSNPLPASNPFATKPNTSSKIAPSLIYISSLLLLYQWNFIEAKLLCTSILYIAIVYVKLHG